ncbi:hypothetical protein Barb7_02709 [Bacteroidales bacterium Barb7]|nr:hypothetical protein Barb7_02709 [Bacteroidales bacterium Barb7]
MERIVGYLRYLIRIITVSNRFRNNNARIIGSTVVSDKTTTSRSLNHLYFSGVSVIYWLDYLVIETGGATYERVIPFIGSLCPHIARCRKEQQGSQ